MTVRRPLALTDRQLGTVIAQAEIVPVPWRERYLTHVVDLLVPVSAPTDTNVAAASLAPQRFAGARGMSKQQQPPPPHGTIYGTIS